MAKPRPVETDEPDRTDDDSDNLICAQRNHLPMSSWERRLVVVSLVIHVANVILDVLVVGLFFREGLTNFGIGSAFVVFWACAASSLYMSCGAGIERQGQDSSNGLDSPRGSRQRQILTFVGNLSQVQIFTEAYRCLFDSDDGSFFHTLRLMEAIMEAAPNSVVQLYALALGQLWPGQASLVRISVLISFLSVGLSFAMFEQKVQVHTSSGYIMGVSVMRTFEIASRSLTLALAAAVTHPHGFWWALILDYLIMVVLTMRHKSVRSSYSFFLSVPLVLMSYEPVVWRREDHVVPKDHYYAVRFVEFLLMWLIIMTQQEGDISATYGMSLCSWGSTLGLLLTLPCIYRIARRHELARDGADNEEFDPLDQGDRDFYSDSGGSEGRDYDSEDDEEAQQQEGLLSGEATNKDESTNDQE